MSQMWDDILPYNKVNKEISHSEITNLLTRFNVNEKLNNIKIYRTAFANKSYITRKNDTFESGNTKCPLDCVPLQKESNERLEFLGDSILNLVVTTYIFHRYPDMNEGFLTNMRTKLVNGNMLAHLSKELALCKHLLISKQIEDNNGRENKNLLEDTFEAFIGAMYIDFDNLNLTGFSKCQTWIIGVFEEYVDFSELINTAANYKDSLIKHCQHNFHWIPNFLELDIHENKTKKMHKVCVKDNGNNIIGIGKNHTRKLAEIDAAEKALQYYGVI